VNFLAYVLGDFGLPSTVTGRYREKATAMELHQSLSTKTGRLFRSDCDFKKQAEQSSFRSGALDKLRKCLHDADRVRSLGNQDGEGPLNPKFRAMDLDQLSRS
jgi:hypothetical protein